MPRIDTYSKKLTWIVKTRKSIDASTNFYQLAGANKMIELMVLKFGYSDHSNFLQHLLLKKREQLKGVYNA